MTRLVFNEEKGVWLTEAVDAADKTCWLSLGKAYMGTIMVGRTRLMLRSDLREKRSEGLLNNSLRLAHKPGFPSRFHGDRLATARMTTRRASFTSTPGRPTAF